VEINRKCVLGLQEDDENHLRMSGGAKDSTGGMKIGRRLKKYERQRQKRLKKNNCEKTRLK